MVTYENTPTKPKALVEWEKKVGVRPTAKTSPMPKVGAAPPAIVQAAPTVPAVMSNNKLLAFGGAQLA